VLDRLVFKKLSFRCTFSVTISYSLYIFLASAEDGMLKEIVSAIHLENEESF